MVAVCVVCVYACVCVVISKLFNEVGATQDHVQSSPFNSGRGLKSGGGFWVANREEDWVNSFLGNLEIFLLKGSGTDSWPKYADGAPALLTTVLAFTRGETGLGMPRRCPGRDGGYLGGWPMGTGGGCPCDFSSSALYNIKKACDTHNCTYQLHGRGRRKKLTKIKNVQESLWMSLCTRFTTNSYSNMQRFAHQRNTTQWVSF